MGFHHRSGNLCPSAAKTDAEFVSKEKVQKKLLQDTWSAVMTTRSSSLPNIAEKFVQSPILFNWIFFSKVIDFPWNFPLQTKSANFITMRESFHQNVEILIESARIFRLCFENYCFPWNAQNQKSQKGYLNIEKAYLKTLEVFFCPESKTFMFKDRKKNI